MGLLEVQTLDEDQDFIEGRGEIKSQEGDQRAHEKPREGDVQRKYESRGQQAKITLTPSYPEKYP